mmetsp:Transcript_4952/g.15673  ORF Transcript_4952/g.15673 Transcript_4952/m.15673 type:complete len:501 (+) Transcript_4952:483-1985(+)
MRFHSHCHRPLKIEPMLELGRGEYEVMGPRPPMHDRAFRSSLHPAAFSVHDSPIWADSSTQLECEAMEEIFGGPDALAAATGSRAYARFTGPQLAATASRNPRAWEGTARVSLVSSLLPSLFLGRVAPIDGSDATGMNLADIGAFGTAWHPGALEALGALPGVRGRAGLEQRLGAPVFSGTVLGPVCEWVVERWQLKGFKGGAGHRVPGRGLPSPLVVAGAGDNPCTAAGLGLTRPGDVALSLGTSDTYMAVCAEAAPQREGHVFASATQRDSYLALLCYANGAKAREKVKGDYSLRSWADFDAALQRGEPGNGGVIGMDLVLEEITPVISRTGRWHARFGEDGKRQVLHSLGDGDVDDPAATAARAVVEGRFLSMRGRGKALGVSAKRGGGRVLAAGGASKSKAIMQIAADVFDADVLVADMPDAAALGAAYRAAHAALAHTNQREVMTYEDFLTSNGVGVGALDVIARPRPDAAAAYSDALVERYFDFEQAVKKRDVF